MTKHDIDYSKGLIYKLVCKNINVTELYVGSTTNFTQRKNTHKSRTKTTVFFVYKFIRDNGGWINWDMILIEKFPCSDSPELRKRERYFTELLGATLNTNKPYISQEETREIKQQYYEDNKNELNKKHKQYYEDNNEIKKQYYNDNKGKISQIQYKGEKIKCECGTMSTNGGIRSHKKTKKHIKLMLSKQQI